MALRALRALRALSQRLATVARLGEREGVASDSGDIALHLPAQVCGIACWGLLSESLLCSRFGANGLSSMTENCAHV